MSYRTTWIVTLVAALVGCSFRPTGQPEVARAFGHEHSATALLEQRLREAITAQNWPLVGEIAKKIAKQDRQAG